METAIQRVVQFLRSYVCNKLRRMSRRVSIDSPRLQLIDNKLVRNTGEKQRRQTRYARHSSRMTAWLESSRSVAQHDSPISVFDQPHRNRRIMFGRRFASTAAAAVVTARLPLRNRSGNDARSTDGSR